MENLFSYGLDAMTAVLIGVATWALGWFGKKSKLESLEPTLQAIVEDAIELAMAKVRIWLKEQGYLDLQAKNDAINKAMKYIDEVGPDTLRKLGYTREQVRRKVEALLEKQIAAAELPPPTASGVA